MTFIRKTRKRDDRDFDTTSLREDSSRRTLNRDYSAHFFRWSFARRLIKKTDHVLEVGCGIEKPLSKILTIGIEAKCASYTGVDMNKLKDSSMKRLTFHGEFNFVERWAELKHTTKVTGGGINSGRLFEVGYDVAVNMEVIEHMKVEHGREMLKGLHSLLKPGGTLLLSTPCFNGVAHAANHIHEYTVPELRQELEHAGFKVRQRFGTFMNVKKVGKNTDRPADVEKSIATVYDLLSDYFDKNAISNIFGPLYPDQARNNLWVCRKEG